MKSRIYTTCVALTIGAVLLSGNLLASEKSRLRFTFRGKKILMDSAVTAVARKREEGWRITIAAQKDGMMLNISGVLEGSFSEKGVSLDTEWHQLSIVFVKNKRVYNGAPSLRMVKKGRVQYVKRSRGERHDASWKRMTRRERLTRGRGIVRNRGAEGSRCSLQVTPVMNGSELVALKGRFEALLVNPHKKRRSGRPVKIRGSFYAEVAR